MSRIRDKASLQTVTLEARRSISQSRQEILGSRQPVTKETTEPVSMLLSQG